MDFKDIHHKDMTLKEKIRIEMIEKERIKKKETIYRIAFYMGEIF